MLKNKSQHSKTEVKVDVMNILASTKTNCRIPLLLFEIPKPLECQIFFSSSKNFKVVKRQPKNEFMIITESFITFQIWYFKIQ